MDNQRLRSIAYARTLRFRIDDDIDRHLQIGTVVHINMAITDPGFNDGDFRFLFHRLNQARAAARNQHINIINRLHQFLGSGMTGIFNQLHHIGIHSRFYQSLPDDGNQCGIGINGIAAARKIIALPVLKARENASTETLGRLSKIMATTPKGTRF